MSARNSYTTADYLEWDSMLSLIRKLFNDGESLDVNRQKRTFTYVCRGHK